MKWAIGLTTIPERRDTTLLTTLLSLREAGFSTPHLFVDGDSDGDSWRTQFGLEVSTRYPRMLAYGNWILGMWELLIRNPVSDMYVMFQDDLIAYKNLRQYLERVKYPAAGGYLNLYTCKDNQSLVPTNNEGQYVDGFWPSNQSGFGALALVFNREAIVQLITSQIAVIKTIASIKPKSSIDGNVVECLSQRHQGPKGWKEYIHSPSLVQHIGEESSLGHYPDTAPCFLGVSFDALSFIGRVPNASLSPTIIPPARTNQFVPPTFVPQPNIHPMRLRAKRGMLRYENEGNT